MSSKSSTSKDVVCHIIHVNQIKLCTTRGDSLYEATIAILRRRKYILIALDQLDTVRRQPLVVVVRLRSGKLDRVIPREEVVVDEGVCQEAGKRVGVSTGRRQRGASSGRWCVYVVLRAQEVA